MKTIVLEGQASRAVSGMFPEYSETRMNFCYKSPNEWNTFAKVGLK